MRVVTKQIGVTILLFNELPDVIKKLFQLAAEARNNAQAPYSNYHVGCAVITKDGKIFKEVNVERNSWTQTTHAEQNGIDTGVAELGPISISAMVVVGAPASNKISFDSPPPQPPAEKEIKDVGDVCPSCGHCLQIIIENCFKATGEYDPDVVLWGYHNGEFYCTTIGEALPMPFLPQYLGTNYTKNNSN